MTTLVKPQGEAADQWGAMPGWQVVADLTPPELIAARRLRVLKRAIATFLVVVVLVCAGGYVLAMRANSDAQDALDEATNQTTTLTSQTGKFSEVTRIQALIALVRSQISTAMTGEVDVAQTMEQIRGQLPKTMTITSLNVTISGLASAYASTPIPTLNTSGDLAIGTVTLSGSAEDMTDVAGYVTTLSQMRGVVDVVPTGNSSVKGGRAHWTITASLTTKVLTGRFGSPTTPDTTTTEPATTDTTGSN